MDVLFNTKMHAYHIAKTITADMNQNSASFAACLKMA